MAYLSVESYYLLLGLPPGATEAEIKQAYRRLAKQLHPDRNKSSYAQRDFIQLTEAYEYLMSHPYSPGAAQQTYHQTYETYQSASHSDAVNEEEVREEARRKAEEHANMKYEDFVNSAYYRNVNSIEVIARHLVILVVILLMVAFCSLLVAQGVGGMIFCALFLALPGRLLYIVLKHQDINLVSLHESLIHIAGRKWFYVVAISLANLYFLYGYVYWTLIDYRWLWVVYTGVMLGSLLAIGAFAPELPVFRKRFYSLCIAPLVIGLLFFFNYVFAGHESVETYPFKYGSALSGGFGLSYDILLPDDKYQDCPHIRSFSNYKSLTQNNHITYTFAKGLLGIRVMKDFRFHKIYQVHIYPHSSTGIINVSMDMVPPGASIQINDETGGELCHSAISQTNTEINLSLWTSRFSRQNVFIYHIYTPDEDIARGAFVL